MTRMKQSSTSKSTRPKHRGLMPTASDFQLLDDLDEFNKHIKAAVALLLSRGYHRLFIKWMLKQHQSYAGAQVLASQSPLVDLVTVQVDERTAGARRRELIEALVEAGALNGEGGNDKRHKRLRDRLSNARRVKRERDEALQPGVVFDFNDPDYIEATIEGVIDDIHGFNATRLIADRLRELGALGGYEGLSDRNLDEVLKVIGEQLVYLETVELTKKDRQRIRAAVDLLDKQALERVRLAQREYLGEGQRMSRRSRKSTRRL